MAKHNRRKAGGAKPEKGEAGFTWQMGAGPLKPKGKLPPNPAPLKKKVAKRRRRL